MFNPTAFENSRPDGISVLEIVNGAEVGENQPRRFVPLRRAELRGEIAGPLASLQLSQVYRFTREECDQVLEAVYRFPLPGDAAVTGVRVRFGVVEIRAELKEREKAEGEYQEAKKQGRQAALLTRESPDVFTLQVAGIAPDQDVTVETSYVQLARAEGPGWNLRIPLTTSPRYVRGDETGSRHAQGQPLLLLRDPGHRFSLDLALVGGGTVDSPTHKLVQTQEDNRVRLRLEGGEVLPDRDCVLSWRLPQDQEKPILQVMLHDDPASGQVYFLALLAPPAARSSKPGIAREVILLVDHSGSMQGPKWEAADWAVKRFLSELTKDDTFALGLFHDKATWLNKAPRTADAKAVQKGIDFLEKHKDTGGTELGIALEQALDHQRGTAEAARHVLVITDAEVTDSGRVLRLADEEAKHEQRRRIDVLCIDAAPNSFLARELAERGGGVARFLTSDPGEEDITTALDEVLADWAQPVVAGLRLEVNRDGVEAAGHALLKEGKKGCAIDLGDLPAGRSLWMAGRLPREPAGEISFRVLTSANREAAGCRVNLVKDQADRPALKALFGARRILGLEFLIGSGYAGKDLEDQLARLGYDPKEVFADQPKKKGKVYAENVRADANRLLRRLLVREALDYGLASSETAFIAVRSESGKPMKGTVAVANALPHGWSEKFETGGIGGFTGAVFHAAFAPMVSSCLASLDYEVDEQEDGGMVSKDITATSALRGAFTGGKLMKMRAPACAVPAASPAAPRADQEPLFVGVPQFEGNEAILFDSARKEDETKLPERVTFVRLQIEFPGGPPNAAALDLGLSLLLFVDDQATPRARVRLADLVRQGGVRPLNVQRQAGQRVRLVLVDASKARAASAPAIQVALHWA
jgi:Ca-activated chloride channel family protein